MRVLVLRPGALGDTLLTFPVLQALKTRWHASHVMLVGNSAVLPLAQACAVADEVASFEDPLWSELFAERGISSPALAQLLGNIDTAICWLRDPEGIVERNLRTQGVTRVIVAPGRPRAEEHIHITTYLACTIGVALEDELSAYRLLEPGRALAKPVPEAAIAVHCGSGGARKCWLVEHFAAVIRELGGRSVPVLLLAGPADQQRLQELQRLLRPVPSSLLSTLIEEPLLEVAWQLRSCKGYLGNDSGITHLAAMLGVPTIALFGPSDPAIWHPIGRCVRVIYKPALEAISPREVLDAFADLLPFDR